ncbi:hypothetical protein [Flavobacterium sp. WC2509]|uniref:hypothetical protein n=1 Tax=Flavobacterium sp. WC2509 TaxID=3461406 RepID=UPI004043EDDC
MKSIFKICSLLFFIHSSAQTISNQEKIKNYIETFFQHDREIIHVQFNKNIYTNNENLAFKGYVWSKNNNAPHANTTNVELTVYNEQLEIVQKQLLFANKGTFSGGIHLNNKFKSGKYTFHFYTNYMNNFKEDDSFTQIIEIINKDEPYNLKSNEPNYKSAEITLFPESGSIINDINNTIGVRIKDCNKRGIEIADGIILDSHSNDVAHFRTNKMGNGAFYLIPKINETYTLKINSDKLTISQLLPKVKETGIAITYNNNLGQNRLLINIKTNEDGIKAYQNKKFTLVIQQDGKSIEKEITFNNKETTQALIIDKEKLSAGVNSIRLIDEDLNEITERLVYIYPTTSAITTFDIKSTANDSIALSAKTDINQANLSISILPENNICLSQKRSIKGTFYLNAYLENPETDDYAYYDLDNKYRKQDMDLLMLNQNKSKFLWENIKSNPPKMNYIFDKGVTISGRVDKVIAPDSNYKISLVSLKDKVFDETPIDKSGNFKFENFYAKDSTVFVLQMVNEKGLATTTKITARVRPNQNMFPLPLQFNTTICPIEKTAENNFTFANLKLDNKSINLKEVIIKTNPNANLKHKADMSGFASAYKIQPGDFGKVLDFIGRKGYRTGIDPTTNDVFIRNGRDAYLGDSSTMPSVYLDNVLVYDLNFLFNLFLNDVDEIYIDSSGSSDITSVGNGTIKIFLKALNSNNKYINPKCTPIIAINGFAQDIQFENTQFATDKEFDYFGTLNWLPNIVSKDNSNYKIEFPKGNQKAYQISLEGFSAEGQLISEIKTIPIPSSNNLGAENSKPTE